MPSLDQAAVQNRLLRAFPKDAFLLFSRSLEKVDLALRQVLVQSDEPTSHVYFIEAGLASVVATSSDNETVEVGHIGREGMSGGHLLLRTEQTPNRTFMQAEGNGLRVAAADFKSFVEGHPVVRDLLLRYVHCGELQLAHSALANARYSVHERLARWLLMCHDRLDGDDLALTHEFLAIMLGVRRSGVTDQIHILEGMKAIRATRGRVRILDRTRLEDIAGGSYGVPEREYERLIGAATKG
jgi:CRP-like cAMP-binding protein